MKKRYPFVLPPTVTASKEIARALIKRGLAFDLVAYERLSEYSERVAPGYAELIANFLRCSSTEFKTDFTKWIKKEIIKIYRNERKKCLQ